MIKGMIADCLRRIFTSENLLENTINSIKDHFGKEMARSYFAQSIYQNNFDAHKNILISTTCFKNLSEIVCLALKACENKKEEFESVRLITNSLFHIYKYISIT